MIWAIEKFQYLLIGKEFDVITDHQAIKKIKNKAEFGTPRIIRWLERLSNFKYNIIFNLGKNMVRSDTLSRLINDIEATPSKEKENYFKQKIMKTHIDAMHRKNISKILQEQNIYK